MTAGLTVINSDCLEALRGMASESIQCVVTSPPYWGLRDYGAAGQIGLERDPAEFVAKMVDVFREVRRVLRKDGTLWLNLGDSYISSGGAGVRGRTAFAHDYCQQTKRGLLGKTAKPGLPGKNLAGMPWRVALALQADGWILRQDIIWHKPNPMPESVADRCTKAHEYLFMMTREPQYHWNKKAMEEKGVIPAGTVGAKGSAHRKAQPGVNSRPPEYKVYSGFRNKRSVWTIQSRPYKGAHFATFPEDLIRPCILASSRPGDVVLDPFGGAGTTAKVSIQHGRRAIAIEINPDYCRLIRERVEGVQLIAI